MSTNLVNELPKRELWERIQETNPDFAELLLSAKEVFGQIRLVEYVDEKLS